MIAVLFDEIGSLVTNDPALGEGLLGLRADSALLCVDGRVAWVGPAGMAPQGAGDRRVKVGSRAVVPGFVDSHTHLVFAGDRSAEFAARLAGTAYRAGGILTTVEATRAASDQALHANVRRLADEALRSGTTTLECKSGYGLTTDDEARSVRIARSVTDETTFLGAHVVPAEFAGRTDDYVALVCSSMLDACAPHARWVDVFCDVGAFDADQAAEVLRAGGSRSLIGRVHANQLAAGPRCAPCCRGGAASADHCTHLDHADVDALAGSDTVATLLAWRRVLDPLGLPGCARLLDGGATVALATDCNPGTRFTTSMAFCIALAVREMRMTPDEAVRSATAGGARALRRRRYRSPRHRGPRRSQVGSTRLRTCTSRTGRGCPWLRRYGGAANELCRRW